MFELHTVSNFHARPVVNGWEVTDEERINDLGYLDWDAILDGTDSFNGFRYRGEIYDLAEFERATDTLVASEWDGWQTQSAFDAIAIRWATDWAGEPDYEAVIVAHLHW